MAFFKTKDLFYEYLEVLNTDTTLTFFDKAERLYKLLKSKNKEQKRIKRFALTSLKNIQLVQNIAELSIEKIELLTEKERISSIGSAHIIAFEGKKVEGLTAKVLNIELYLLNNIYGYSKSTLVSDGKLAFSQLLYSFNPKYDLKNPLQQSFSSLVMKKSNHSPTHQKWN